MFKKILCLGILILTMSNFCKAETSQEAAQVKTFQSIVVLKEVLKEVLEKKLSAKELEFVMQEVERAKERLAQENKRNESNGKLWVIGGVGIVVGALLGLGIAWAMKDRLFSAKQNQLVQNNQQGQGNSPQINPPVSVNQQLQNNNQPVNQPAPLNQPMQNNNQPMNQQQVPVNQPMQNNNQQMNQVPMNQLAQIFGQLTENNPQLLNNLQQNNRQQVRDFAPLVHFLGLDGPLLLP